LLQSFPSDDDELLQASTVEEDDDDDDDDDAVYIGGVPVNNDEDLSTVAAAAASPLLLLLLLPFLACTQNKKNAAAVGIASPAVTKARVPNTLRLRTVISYSLEYCRRMEFQLLLLLLLCYVRRLRYFVSTVNTNLKDRYKKQ
jgi:hypothetical protein